MQIAFNTSGISTSLSPMDGPAASTTGADERREGTSVRGDDRFRLPFPWQAPRPMLVAARFLPRALQAAPAFQSVRE